MSLSSETFVCKCHEIDWMTPLKNGGITVYNYTDGTEHLQGIDVGKGLPCGDKVNMRHITHEDSLHLCQYSDWSDRRTKMPKDLITYIQEWGGHSPYDSRFDIHHPDHYLNHYYSLQDLIIHLDKPNWFEFEPIQGTTDETQAKRDIVEIEGLKQDSLNSE